MREYRKAYQGFFIKRLRGADDDALADLLKKAGRKEDPASFKEGAETVVGIYDCRGKSTKLRLYPEDAPLAAAAVMRSGFGKDVIVLPPYDESSDKRETLKFKEVMEWVMERQIWQRNKSADLQEDDKAFLTEEAKRATAIRGITAIIATHDFVENPGTRYED